MLDASEHFKEAGRLPFSRNQFGGTIGGPIRKDKTFYFANYEELNQKLIQTAISTVPGNDFRKGILPCSQTTDYDVTDKLCLLPGSTPTTPVNVGINSNIAGYLGAFPVVNGPSFADGSAQNFSQLAYPRV